MSILKDYYENHKNIKTQLQEFLQELKINQNVNISQNLENRVDIDYVIEKITDILKEG